MKVNFVSEITAFYRWLKSNHISNNAQLLWFHLFCYWNEAGFPDWLQVDTLRLMGMVQLKSKNTLIRARDELINAGLLTVAKGKHKAPNKYQFVLFDGSNRCGSNFEPQTGSKTGSKMGSKTGTETGRLYKLNQTKANSKKEKTAYGEFGNVLLSIDEVAKLQADHPDSWVELIRRLDIGKESKGYQYSNDYAALLTWIDKDEREKTEQAFQELMADLY